MSGFFWKTPDSHMGEGEKPKGTLRMIKREIRNHHKMSRILKKKSVVTRLEHEKLVAKKAIGTKNPHS